MILRCLVVTITRNRKGQAIRTGTIVAGDPITIGRSPESSLYLPDPRVHLNHAVIRSNDLGKLYLEAQGAAIAVNGELQDRAKLRRGARILIGPYEITPEPSAGSDHDFGLAVEMVQPIPPGLGSLPQRSSLTLAATHLSKRGLSWAAILAVAVFGLALPLAHATSPAFRERSARSLPAGLKDIAWTVAWSPGPLSQGHHKITASCASCHAAPFERVTDAACQACHKTTGAHVPQGSAVLDSSLGMRCAACHPDHRGDASRLSTGAEVCVGCHGRIDVRYPRASLPNVTDFAKDHPPFRLSMTDATSGRVVRADLLSKAEPREASGLKFPHAPHLSARGVRSPAGSRVLQCSDCHAQDEANQRFQPVRMKENCSECHRLEFEPSATARLAPHAEPEVVLMALREFYARVALGEQPLDVAVVNELLLRPTPGAAVPQRANALRWADLKAAAVARDLIETRVCVQCHVVDRQGGNDSSSTPRWKIAPVRITTHWLPGAAFDHKSHRASTCESCHDVRNSMSSADIAIPDLKNCQTCHGGEHPDPGKLKSPCQTCHGYHQQPEGGPRMPVVRPVGAPSAGVVPQ